MSERTDLTRWNRAGLSHFRYLEGNAATYLEALRLALRERFAAGEWSDLEVVVPSDESEDARLERLREQYEGERRDWGWEILRSLARSCHVLAGYTDAYGNEGFLGTASQWDNVRRLVGMLDYHPAPPASASTRLALAAKEDREPGTVEAGFQVKHSPADGGEPVVFETLDDVEVDPALNALRLAGWDRSVAPLVATGTRVTSPVGRRRARDIQGVGERYAARLDAYKQALTRDPDAVFTIADFVELPFSPGGAGIRPVHLWEFRKKAELLLAAAIDPEKLAPVLGEPVAELVEMPLDELAGLTSLSEEELAELQGELRKAQIALDETAFNDDSLERRFLAQLGREVDVQVPAVRLRDLVGGTEEPASPWLAAEDEEVSAGDLGVVGREATTPQGAVVRVDEVEATSGELGLSDAPEQPDWRPWPRGECSLLLGPKFIEQPWLNGPGVVTFNQEHGLAAGEVIAWRQRGAWRFARVAEADEMALRLAGTAQPAAGTDVYQALEIDRGGSGLEFPARYRAAARPTSAGFRLIRSGDYTQTGSGDAAYRKLRSAAVRRLYLVGEDAEAVGRTVATSAGEYTFDGSPGKLAGGQWVVADDGRILRALRIESISELEKTFTVRFRGAATPLPPIAGAAVRVVQGIGARYGELLAERGVRTLAQLAALDPATSTVRISRVRLWEFRTKAELIVGFAADAAALEAVLGHSLAGVVRRSDTGLAELLGASEHQAREIKDGLRLIEAVIDQPTFRATRVSELLPGGGPSGDGDEAVLEKLVRLYGDFEHTLRPEGWDRNQTPLVGSELALDPDGLGELPALLQRGRKLILEQESGDDFTGAVEAQVLTADAARLAIGITPALSEEQGFTLGNTVLRANVVAAGHGESRPEKVLGSGDATQPNPSFVLEVENVSFVADATQPSGVRADITVKVGDQEWQQVANLKDSEPADAAYTVRMTEEGYLRIGFGDGRHGRRLPSGSNNLKVGYRVGSGLAGAVAAGSLVKAVRPHHQVDSVRQPLAASGGGDMETIDSLRENAPASLLTLERAVSLADFTHLAARQSSVWQARAFARTRGGRRHEDVQVVVVPAGGGQLGDLEASLESFLQAHAVPGVDVRVSPFVPREVDLRVTVRVDSDQYEPDEVLDSVRQALIEAFSLEERKLGQDLFLSEVYAVVEETTGVENSTCVINDDAGLRRLEASDREVVYLDSTHPTLELIYEEYAP